MDQLQFALQDHEVTGYTGKMGEYGFVCFDCCGADAEYEIAFGETCVCGIDKYFGAGSACPADGGSVGGGVFCDDHGANLMFWVEGVEIVEGVEVVWIGGRIINDTNCPLLTVDWFTGLAGFAKVLYGRKIRFDS